MINVNLLKSKMAIRGDKMRDLAEALDINVNTLTKKFQGLTEFRVDEAKIIQTRYGLDPEDMDAIFFNAKLDANSTQECEEQTTHEG